MCLVKQLLNRFYELLDSEARFFNAPAKTEVAKLGMDLLILYSQLSTEAKNERRKQWKWNPKHHLFQHLCEWCISECGNPRFFWCYGDEDLVGKLIEVARSCHPRTMAEVAMFKWLLLTFDP